MNLCREHWNEEDYEKYIGYLKSLQDENYRKFHQSLTTTRYEILGLRVPMQRKIAKEISNILQADIFEIKPKIPYSKDDLNWQDENSRSSLEMKRLISNPDIIDQNINFNNYERIFIGFPIWWYEAPTIIHSFLKKYYFKNKTIILFASSGSSLFGKTKNVLEKFVDSSNIMIEGKVFHNFNKKDIDNWINNFKEN